MGEAMSQRKSEGITSAQAINEAIDARELYGEEAAEAISDFAGLELVPLDEDEQRRRASPTFQESQRHALRAEMKGNR